MERLWLNVGKKYTEGKESELAEKFTRVSWKEVPCDLGALPGLAIDAAIDQLNIPRVSHVAASNELAPYSLLGIRGHYKGGYADIFLIDTGTEILPLASDYYPD